MRQLAVLSSLLATSSKAALISLIGAQQPGILDSRESEAGLVQIECLSENATYYFRGAIIDSGDADASYEVILTSLHGLPDDLSTIRRTCVVKGAQGSHVGIKDIWRPDSRGYVSPSDWAVLLTNERLRDAIERLSAVRVPYPGREKLAANDIPVRLPLRFVEGERACSLTQFGPAGVRSSEGLFAHTCRTWPGLSGSPILISIDDQPFVLGIHLGSRWPYDRDPALGIGRFVDATIAEAINAAVAKGKTETALAITKRHERERRREQLRVGTVLR